jgi:hypothetical protein
VQQEDYFYQQLQAEKKKLTDEFTWQLNRLQTQRDSLEGIISKNRRELKGQRLKTKILSERMLKSVNAAIDSCAQDSLRPQMEKYVQAQEENDSICDASIYSLETMVANRDSSLEFCRSIGETQKQMLKDQELRNQQLTDQLNTAYKMQKKKSRQNKILAGGIMIISGITTSILIISKSL